MCVFIKIWTRLHKPVTSVMGRWPQIPLQNSFLRLQIVDMNPQRIMKQANGVFIFVVERTEYRNLIPDEPLNRSNTLQSIDTYNHSMAENISAVKGFRARKSRRFSGGFRGLLMLFNIFEHHM